MAPAMRALCPIASVLVSGAALYSGRIPERVIVDTDIGDQMDDAYAMAMLLTMPGVDVRLVVADSSLAQQRAEVLARFLTLAGEIRPIAVGPGLPDEDQDRLSLDGWASSEDWQSYPQRVGLDAADAIIEEVLDGASAGLTTTIVVLSPCSAVAAAISREPTLTRHARIVGMGGSLRFGDNGTGTPYAEWNVKSDVEASQLVYGSAWKDIPLLAPLDASGQAQLIGEAFDTVTSCESAIAHALSDMRQAWLPNVIWPETLDGPLAHVDGQHASAVLWDAVAATLVTAFSPDQYLVRERLPIIIKNNGMTVIANDTQADAHWIEAATGWRDADGWRDLVACKVCQQPHKRPQQRTQSRPWLLSFSVGAVAAGVASCAVWLSWRLSLRRDKLEDRALAVSLQPVQESQSQP